MGPHRHTQTDTHTHTQTHTQTHTDTHTDTHTHRHTHTQTHTAAHFIIIFFFIEKETRLKNGMVKLKIFKRKIILPRGPQGNGIILPVALEFE